MFQRKTLLIAVVVLSVLLAASALLTVPPDSYTRFMVYIPPAVPATRYRHRGIRHPDTGRRARGCPGDRASAGVRGQLVRCRDVLQLSEPY